MNLQRCFILLFLLPLLASCNKPAKEFCFIELSHTCGFDAPATLTLDITDTLTPMQMNLSARLFDSAISENGTISVVFKAISPSGLCGCDTLYLPVKRKQNSNIAYNEGNGTLTLNWPYRKNIIFKESGVWTFSISPYNRTSQNDLYKNITGLGISCKKENTK